MSIQEPPIAQPYYASPVYIPNQHTDFVPVKWFILNVTIDMLVKVSFALYNPYLITHIIVGFCGYIGAYYKKKYLLILYAVYQLTCFCMGTMVLLDINNNKYTKLNIDTKYWYVYISCYLIESLIMIIYTSNFITKIKLPEIHQPFIVNE